MIVNVTMQDVCGDCPSNIVIDLDKLETIDDEDARLYVQNIKSKKERRNRNRNRKIRSK
jgi:hypothetical protein